MKSLYFTEDHDIFRQSVRQFIETEVTPQVDKWEEEECIPRDIFKRMGELGFLGIDMPEEYGGSAVDFFYTVILLDEVTRCGSGGFAAAHSVHQYMSTAHILKAGSPELKQKYLPGAIDGSLIGALAISEPGAGSDVANIRTTAVRDGDHYVINGSKTFITNGVYGNFATVACKTNPDAGAAGISLIVVDQGLPGFTTNKLNKVGWKSSDTGELFFDNVRVPVSNLIGAENQGFYYIMESFQLERLVAGVSAVYGAEHGLNVTLKYISEREAFGRPIKKFQTIRHELVDLATEIESAKQFTLHTCWLYDNDEFAVKECSMIKLLNTELAKRAADICLQCFGGYGYMEEYPVARMYRDARVGTIVGGTSAIMREILSKIIIDDVSYSSSYDTGGTMESKNKTATEQESVTENNGLQSTLTNSKNNNGMDKTPETAAEIIRSLPTRFKADKADGFAEIFHFDIEGDNGGQFTVVVKDSTCAVSDGHEGEASCKVSSTDSVYEDVELGRTNPQMAVMMGKIKISNIGAMMKFIGLFSRLA